MNLLLQLFNKFGSYAHVTIFFLSIFFLWNKDNLLFYFIVGFIVNKLLNLVLKGIFQQPRPSEDIKTFNLAIEHGKRFIFKDGMPYDIFGMPSGHAQTLLFSTAFIYLALRNKKIFYLYLLISIITLCQRVVFKHHTIIQVLVGSIIGTLFGYFVYYLSGEKIKGRITEKLDDFGPF
jgi:membrane-associated phospholipid phosphatase